MRSATLLTSALAVGAIAKPLRHQHKRYVVTTVDLDVVTVTKFVTAGYEEPAPTPAAASVKSIYNPQHVHSHSDKPAPPASSAYTPPPVVVSTPAYTPPAPSSAPSSAAAPVYSSPSEAAAPSVSSGGSSGGYTSTQDISGKSYADSIVSVHNLARKNHGHDPVTWDDSLASVAMKVAQTCKFEHWSPVEGQGQNLFTASGGFGNVASALFESWYAREAVNMTDFNAWNTAQPTDEVFELVGHLTQMVWKATTKIGCASLDCGAKMLTKEGGTYKQSGMNKFTVCQYASPGNYAGEYVKNVGKPKQLDIILSAIKSKTDISSLISSLSKVIGF